MVEFYDCFSEIPPLNLSAFELRDWFLVDADVMQRYASYCQEQSCNQTIGAKNFCAASLDKAAGGCWPRTNANEVAVIPCPRHITLFQSEGQAHRVCDNEGVWRTLSYDGCISEGSGSYVKILLYLGGSLSITSSILAFIILHSLTVLQCGRVTLHKHFFVSNVGYCVCWILKFAVLELMTQPAWCRVMEVTEVLTAYFTVNIYAWMANEGLFLYAHVVLGFVSEQKLLRICSLIGWGLPLAPTTVFIVRALMLSNAQNAEYCWSFVMADTIVNHFVIAPIALALIINFYFLVHIVITLWRKMRGVTQHSRETNQTRKAVRAVLILFPLLGMQQLILVIQPDHSSNFHAAYEVISMLCTSCQGTVVAILFCFSNGEVIAALRRKSRIVRLLFKPCGGDEVSNSEATHHSTITTNHTSIAAGDIQKTACNYSRLSVKQNLNAPMQHTVVNTVK